MNNPFKFKRIAGCLGIALSLFAAIQSSYAYPFPGGGEAIEAPQERITVKGRITDSAGEPLIGVTVVSNGEQGNIAISDAEGHYTIMAPDNGVLEFSLVGMQSEKIPVNGREIIDVTLKDDNILLDELVVVGFGSQKKENLTGAVTTVNVARTMESKPFTDPAKGLQGAVPGLTVTFSNGAINNAPAINIRGMGSLNATDGGSPLIMVDNVVVSDISLVNSDDIESISVLKDAASTSIYGARAAFGVILIKTRSGKMGSRFSVNYSNNFSWGTPTVLPEFPQNAVAEIAAMEAAMARGKQAFDMFGMKAQPLMEGITKWIANYSHNRHGHNMIMGEDFEIKDGVTYFYRLWDPVKEMYRKWTPQQNHALQITGGSEKISFVLSGGYQYQEGILKIKPDILNKYNLSLSMNAKAAEWVDIEARMNMRQTDYDYPYSYQDPFYYMWRWGTYFPYGTYTDETGTTAWFRHIPGYLHNASYCTNRQTYQNAQIAATFHIGEYVDIRSEFAYSTTHRNIHETGGYVAMWDFWGGGLNYNTKLPGSSYDEVDFTSSRTTQITSNTYATFERSFGNHNLKVTGGINVETGQSHMQFSQKMGLMDKAFGQLPLATGAATVNGSAADWAVVGWFARINYNWLNKYLVEINGRYDGSSNFPSHSRWAFFPSFSVGYRISEEEFFAPAREIVSDLKIRGSYGLIGNQNVGADRFIPTMSTAYANWLVDGAKVLYTGLPANVSSNLHWEDVATLDLGLDIRFLNNDYGITFDWFQRVNRNMLSVGETLPETFGTAAAMVNDGRLRTRGWELTIDGSHSFPNGLSIYGSVNISDYKSVITEWNANSANLLTSNYKGKTIGEIWGFETDRYFTSEEDVANSPSQKGLQTGNFVFGPGDIKYKDLNGDNIINAGNSTLQDHGDLKVIGNTTPRYQYSFRIGGTWKGFDMDIYFQGIGKRQLWATGNEAIPYYRGADVMYQHQMDFWSPENPNARYPLPYTGNGSTAISGIRYMANAAANSGNNFYPQTKYLLNLSYLRLKNLTIGYTLPHKWTSRMNLTKARIYFSGENLFEFSQKKIPIDPEITAGSSTSNFYGRTAPFERTISFGIQLSM
ncbi:MAG: TonB-dependent receptor [Bacteroidales bacterium]|nr:TonB-dependent receptor [Bacteroidales bacterium]